MIKWLSRPSISEPHLYNSEASQRLWPMYMSVRERQQPFSYVSQIMFPHALARLLLPLRRHELRIRIGAHLSSRTWLSET
jgi:hypothetical protein